MKKIFINGTFDVLHRGHIELFKYAKALGDFLIVAIDSDKRVRELKGSSRPFNSEEDRAFMVSSLKYVDETTIFGTDLELEKIIQSVHPDIMVVGSDWEGKRIVGSEYAKKLMFFDRIDGYSTTRILDNK